MGTGNRLTATIAERDLAYRPRCIVAGADELDLRLGVELLDELVHDGRSVGLEQWEAMHRHIPDERVR